MKMPDEILCSKTHEWILEENNHASIGLTDYGIEVLGDIIFVDLPEIGSSFSKGESFASIESVKAATEVYMPVSGKITEINEQLTKSPELLNDENFESWLVKIECEDFSSDSYGLLEYDDYLDEIN